MAAETEAVARYVPPGSCSWCGHPPHPDHCPKSIRTGKGTQAPCPCSRAAWARNREANHA